MSVKLAIFTVGFDKNGEAEFGVNASVMDLSHKDMKELRAMVPVAIGQMERMWYDAQMQKPENRAGQERKP